MTQKPIERPKNKKSQGAFEPKQEQDEEVIREDEKTIENKRMSEENRTPKTEITKRIKSESPSPSTERARPRGYGPIRPGSRQSTPLDRRSATSRQRSKEWTTKIYASREGSRDTIDRKMKREDDQNDPKRRRASRSPSGNIYGGEREEITKRSKLPRPRDLNRGESESSRRKVVTGENQRRRKNPLGKK